MERTDIYLVEDNTAWEPIVDDSPIVDPENDVFGYYD